MRKHAKKFKQKRSVTRTLITAAVHGDKRTVTEVEPGTEGAVEVKQDDGSVKHFLVERNVITPAVYKVTANGPTTTKGKPNLGGATVKKESK
jgi:hypothetical protein